MFRPGLIRLPLFSYLVRDPSDSPTHLHHHTSHAILKPQSTLVHHKIKESLWWTQSVWSNQSTKLSMNHSTFQNKRQYLKQASLAHTPRAPHTHALPLHICGTLKHMTVRFRGEGKENQMLTPPSPVHINCNIFTKLTHFSRHK